MIATSLDWLVRWDEEYVYAVGPLDGRLRVVSLKRDLNQYLEEEELGFFADELATAEMHAEVLFTLLEEKVGPIEGAQRSDEGFILVEIAEL
jgi:hypothetical protein